MVAFRGKLNAEFVAGVAALEFMMVENGAPGCVVLVTVTTTVLPSLYRAPSGSQSDIVLLARCVSVANADLMISLLQAIGRDATEAAWERMNRPIQCHHSGRLKMLE